MGSESCSINILMFPWLAHGHISGFLELAKKLSKRNFYIYLCSTSANFTSIKDKLPEEDPLLIQLVEIQLPSLPDLSPRYHTTNGLPPNLMDTLKEALHMARPNFSSILRTIKPDLVIYDFIQDWVPIEASLLNIPTVQFSTMGAATMSYFLHLVQNPNDEFQFPAIYYTDFELIQFKQKMLEDSMKYKSDRDCIFRGMEGSSDIIMIKSCREIEAKYIDHASVLAGKRFVPVGLIVQEPTNKDEDNDIMEWLNKKEKGSTVFASFGSEYFLSKEEMEEIAHGIELSKVNFIWVVRFPAGKTISLEEALPNEFLERTKEKGLVVQGWAPQGQILKHSSIGGFLSHCGWNSSVEALKFGMPIIGLPMHLDQPFNARLFEEIGAGLEVKRDKEGRLGRNDIARVIKKIVMEKEGEAVRRKVRYLSEIIANKGDKEIDGVVEELVRISNKKLGL